MLVRAPLRWMVPVALAAAVLAPAAAAELPGLGGLLPPEPAAPQVPAVPSPSEVGAEGLTLTSLMAMWAERQAANAAASAPEPHPEEQGAQASGAAAKAQQTAQGAQQQANGYAETARGEAQAEGEYAQGQAQMQAAQAQAKAKDVMQMVPDDPVGFATGTAQQAAEQATQTLPGLDEPGAVEPQSSSTQTVAADPGLLPPILAGSILVAGAAGATFFAFWVAGSSGTVATGAAAAKTTELRRLLPFASPLFTRFERETVLGHPRREALYALILQQPGISLQALGESTGLSRTAVLHHLRLLEMQHLIVSKRMGRSRHYYENGGRYGRDAKEAYAILQNARSKEVADFIRTHPGAMQKQLCEALHIQPSIAHWHVRRLQAAQLVECVRQGRAVNYFPGRGLLEVAAQPALPTPLPEAAPLPVAAPATMPLGA